jgi:hypothetical protein
MGIYAGLIADVRNRPGLRKEPGGELDRLQRWEFQVHARDVLLGQVRLRALLFDAGEEHRCSGGQPFAMSEGQSQRQLLDRHNRIEPRVAVFLEEPRVCRTLVSFIPLAKTRQIEALGEHLQRSRKFPFQSPP